MDRKESNVDSSYSTEVRLEHDYGGPYGPVNVYFTLRIDFSRGIKVEVVPSGRDWVEDAVISIDTLVDIAPLLVRKPSEPT